MTSEPARTVVITGAAGEIGGHLVSHYVGAGWTVWALDRRPVAPRNGVAAAACDLTDAAQVRTAIDGLAERHGAPDALVNCAGLIANAPLVMLGPEGWQVHDAALWSDVVASGLTGAFHATAHCVRHMLRARKRGVVVNISSICAAGNPGQAAYSAAKSGLNGLTLALAKELGRFGIRVVGLAPGYFDTASTAANVPQEKLEKIAAAVPLKRLGRVDEIAHAIDFIIGNGYVNGTVIELDGGLII